MSDNLTDTETDSTANTDQDSRPDHQAASDDQSATEDDPEERPELTPSGELQLLSEQLLAARFSHDWHPDLQQELAGIEQDLRRVAAQQEQLEQRAAEAAARERQAPEQQDGADVQGDSSISGSGSEPDTTSTPTDESVDAPDGAGSGVVAADQVEGPER